MFRNRLEFLRWGVVSPPPTPQAGGPRPVGCPRLLIQYIRSYPSYLQAVSSIRNLRTRHVVVTGVPLNMDCVVLLQYEMYKIISKANGKEVRET
jgi:hypothetical protein